ncbi:MAG TPA: amidase [Dehalococcoidia bacterium]|nr:amidase [Dehalococcoidia bacterium]
MNRALLTMPATEVAALIRSRELAARDYLDSLRARIEEREPLLKAWETLDLEGAYRQAEALDKEAASGKLRGPLHGIPIAAKDVFCADGLPARGGLAALHDYVPDFDATAVARLRRAGAIVVGKTATTQLAYVDPAPTRNPWNLEHTPGGSSSGSAAAVADGMVPAALGTQTAASTLRPAAFCGLVGLKATYGRIGRKGMFLLAPTLDHVGLIVRTVSDAALFLSAMAGKEEGDPTASGRPVGEYLSAIANPSPPRIGFLRGLFQERTQPETWARLEQSVEKLRASGAIVEEVPLPADFPLILDAHQVILVSEAGVSHFDTFRRHPDDFRPQAQVLMETSQLVPATAYLRALQIRRYLQGGLGALFNGYDLLLTAVATGPAPRGLEWTGDPVCAIPWTFLGLPALALPMGLGSQGLPLGLQLIAPAWQEERLLAGARWCEMALAATPDLLAQEAHPA